MDFLTRQQIFDRVKTHLLTQNAKATSGGGICKYRGVDNRKCAIGCLIPDSLYEKAMEGYLVNGLFVDFPYAMSMAGLHRDDEEFLRDLQKIHDGHLPPFWPKLLTDFAVKNKLQP